jgi:hypothetical protein
MPKPKLGTTLLKLEKSLEELTDSKTHDLQWGDVLALVHSWLTIHAPHAREEYLDGTHPIFYYGAGDDS